MRDPLTPLDWLGVAVVLSAICSSLLTVQLPSVFVPLYEDFDPALPLVTRLAFLRWPLLLPALTATLLLAAGATRPAAAARRALWLGAFTVAAGGVLVTVLALYLPLFQLTPLD